MDKEDCIQVLLSILQQPWWKSCDSVTDWDLKNVLWKAGLLLTPEQVAALFADIKRRGLVSACDRRVDDHIVALWAVKITPAGEEWLVQRVQSDIRRQTVAPSEASKSNGQSEATQTSSEAGPLELSPEGSPQVPEYSPSDLINDS